MMNVKKMVVYYSFVFYCMVMFSFIACIILLCKAFGGVVFEVQTYKMCIRDSLIILKIRRVCLMRDIGR